MNPMEDTYRTAVATGASGFSLLIALYDTLAGDLRRAAGAQRAKDLEQRSKELNHALRVLAVLESSTDAERGALAQGLVGFYANTRRQILEAQGKQSAEMLEHLMTEVLKLRELWQKMEAKGTTAEPQILPPATRQQPSNPFRTEPERRSSSWVA